MRFASAVALLLAVAVTGAIACSDRPAPSADTSGAVPASSLWTPPQGASVPAQARPGAFAPWLAAAADGLLLTWLEPAEPGHRLRFARFTVEPPEASWSDPVTVAEGPDFFANWADVPSVAEAEDGTLLAQWLEKTGEGTYAYGIRLARSRDGGATWEPLGFLHDDTTPTEHGFVSLLPAGGDRFRAFWLDGRRMVDDGPMTLRTALVGQSPERAEVLDDRVCECCPTAGVKTPAGPLVAYRNRSPEEVRDIHLRRRRDGAWSQASPLHRDGWVFPACPVNGPALTAEGDRVAAAWFTAEGGEPRVLAAFSGNGGADFGPPVAIDRGKGVLGRVGIAWGPEGEAVVSWLAVGEESGGVYLRRMDADGAPDGASDGASDATLGEPWRLATTAASRASGIPRLRAREGLLYAVWVETTDGTVEADRGESGESRPSGLRFQVLRWDDLPAPGGGK